MLKSARGFSLIELMVTIAVMGILMGVALPNLVTWMANTRVRSAADTLQNALRQAQSEAVLRSRQTVLALTAVKPALGAPAASNSPNWYSQTLPLSGSDDVSGTLLRVETIAKTQSVDVTGPAVICFNSMGRLVANSSTGLGASCSASGSFTTYELNSEHADRPLRVEVYLGGRVRMCDPAKVLSTTHPDGCA